MNAVVWKFKLKGNTREAQVVEMPAGRIVCVDVQHNEVTLWAQVTPGSPSPSRKFVCIETGDEAPDGTYLGTVQLDGGLYVLHVYQIHGSKS